MDRGARECEQARNHHHRANALEARHPLWALVLACRLAWIRFHTGMLAGLGVGVGVTRATIHLVDATTRRRIVALVQAGEASSQAIAQSVGVSARTVSRIRREAGLEAPVGRPATGRRPKVWPTVDDDVEAALVDEAERTDTTPSAVAATVLTEWERTRSKR